MHGENTLYPNPIRNLPHREGSAHPGFVGSDDHTLENLDALFIALTDLHVHLYRISDPERRDIDAHVIAFDHSQQHASHNIPPITKYKTG
jgi:hypothetical protein